MNANKKCLRTLQRWPLALSLLTCALGSAAGEEQGDKRDPSRAVDSRVGQGFAIAPVPLELKGKNHALVGLGSYLVNAASGCSDCHTEPAYAPGGNPFNGEPEAINAAAYLAGGRAFGPFVSANLTPDATGRPAGLSLEAFVAVMRTGRDPDDPSRILQVMPWPYYGKMTSHELRAIYEYLRAVPSLPNN